MAEKEKDKKYGDGRIESQEAKLKMAPQKQPKEKKGKKELVCHSRLLLY